jgi:hypothetical protein
LSLTYGNDANLVVALFGLEIKNPKFKENDMADENSVPTSGESEAGASSEKGSFLRKRFESLARQRSRATAEEKANFQPPPSYEEGKTVLANLIAEIRLLKGKLANKIDSDFPDHPSYKRWKAGAGIVLSRMKARQILLENWLRLHKPLEIHAQTSERAGDPVKVQEFEAPSSLEVAQAEVTELTPKIMTLQAELAAMNNSDDDPKGKGIRRKAILAKMKPMEIRRQLLNGWIKSRLREQHDEVDVRRKVLAGTIDPENPASVLLHCSFLLGRLIKKSGVPLGEDDEKVMDAMKSYLRRNGLAQ